jgi:hypothetical protein
MQQALQERADAMENRATALLHEMLEMQADWLRRLGTPPADERSRTQWIDQARVVVAYRDRWNVHSPEPLGDSAHSVEQAAQERRAAAAVARARAIANRSRDGATEAQLRQTVRIEPPSAPGLDP